MVCNVDVELQTHAPVSIRKHMPDFLSITMRRFEDFLPPVDSSIRTGGISFPFVSSCRVHCICEHLTRKCCGNNTNSLCDHRKNCDLDSGFFFDFDFMDDL